MPKSQNEPTARSSRSHSLSLIREATGGLFVAAGLLKLLPAHHEFAALLLQAGVPLPRLAAVAVPLLEAGGGLALCFNRAPRPFAALLAIDMMAALALVGAPGLRGRAQHIGPYTIGTEPWRVPLEVILLVAMLWIVFKEPEKLG